MTRSLPGPLQRGLIRRDIISRLRRVFLHHRLEWLPDFFFVVDNEQMHYWGGAVNGGGKRLSKWVGSARTA